MPPPRIHSKAPELLRSLGIERVEDAWRTDLPGEIVNDRGDRQVLRLTPSEGPAVYLKRWRFALDSLHRHLPGKRALRLRARNEFENLSVLSEGGIRVPTPLALGETPGLWGPIATFLLLEELTGFREAAGLPMGSPDESRKIVRGVTRTLASLHRLGLYWRSPGLKHFYVDDSLKNFALIDVPRLEARRSSLAESLLRALGGDPPCRERDLSKLLAELLDRQPDRKLWVDAFWEGGAEVFPEEREALDWRIHLLRLAEKRSAARDRR